MLRSQSPTHLFLDFTLHFVGDPLPFSSLITSWEVMEWANQIFVNYRANNKNTPFNYLIIYLLHPPTNQSPSSFQTDHGDGSSMERIYFFIQERHGGEKCFDASSLLLLCFLQLFDFFSHIFFTSLEPQIYFFLMVFRRFS